MKPEVITTRTGGRSVRDAETGEVMHPIGALAEARALYAEQARLAERLSQPGPPLVLYDVGLGAGSNALAAREIAERVPAHDAPRAAHGAQLSGDAQISGAPISGNELSTDVRGSASGRALELVSFERDVSALRMALMHAADFGLLGEPGEAARALLDHGEHRGARTHWRLLLGDALAALPNEPSRCDVVFWDPFSPQKNPELWTVRAFAALRARCNPGCTLFTYSASTAVRTALLLAGFAVGTGAETGSKAQTTCAAVDLADLARPLGARFLQRVLRSSAALPSDAPPGALEQLRALPQLQR